jgi:hypothetical protein
LSGSAADHRTSATPRAAPSAATVPSMSYCVRPTIISDEALEQLARHSMSRPPATGSTAYLSLEGAP